MYNKWSIRVVLVLLMFTTFVVPVRAQDRTRLFSLKPADMVAVMASPEVGFVCDDVVQEGVYNKWRCGRVFTSEEVQVTVLMILYARTLDTVDNMTMFVIQPQAEEILLKKPALLSDIVKVASPLFVVMARLPYDEEQVKDQVETWIKTSLPLVRELGDVRMTVIDGVSFGLSGSPAAWMLVIDLAKLAVVTDTKDSGEQKEVLDWTTNF